MVGFGCGWCGENERKAIGELLNFRATPGPARDVTSSAWAYLTRYGTRKNWRWITSLVGARDEVKVMLQRLRVVFVVLLGSAVGAIAAFQGLARCDDFLARADVYRMPPCARQY